MKHIMIIYNHKAYQKNSERNDTESDDSRQAEDLSISKEVTDDSTSDNENQNTTFVGREPVSAEWRVRRSKDPPNFPFLIKTDKNFSITKTPMEYFCQYYSKYFLENVCTSSNTYAVLKNLNTTFHQTPLMLKQYLGIHFYMTLIKLGASRRFWETLTGVPQVADVMRPKTFEQVTKISHFEGEENTSPNSRTWKFQLALDTFNNVAGGIPMHKHLSNDEQIIVNKGKKSSLCQNNPKKPKKWGFKTTSKPIQ